MSGPGRSSSPTFAVIGAGPAGSHTATRLAEAGFHVQLFDPKGAWEKPCGGGVTLKALDQFGFLVDPTWPSQPVERITLVGPNGRRLVLDLDRPFRIFSRARLNGLLLERASAAGAEFVQHAVTRFERDGDGWRLSGKGGEWTADILVGADGAGSIIRRELVGRFRPADIALTIGYNAWGVTSTEVAIEFPPDFTGYLWAFPRTDHINFGIANRLNERPAAELKQVLHEFIEHYWREQYSEAAPIDTMEFFGAKIPMLARGGWDNARATGPDWALVGDAAGFVDPITGEGIYFALRSAELLTRAFAEGEGLDGYERAWLEDFGDDLAAGSYHVDRFYRGSFLGGAVIDRALLFSERHPGIRRVMKRALGGEQSYATLRRDLVLSALRFF